MCYFFYLINQFLKIWTLYTCIHVHVHVQCMCIMYGYDTVQDHEYLKTVTTYIKVEQK